MDMEVIVKRGEVLFLVEHVYSHITDHIWNDKNELKARAEFCRGHIRALQSLYLISDDDAEVAFVKIRGLLTRAESMIGIGLNSILTK